MCFSFWCCPVCCCPRDFRFVYVAEGKQWTEGGPIKYPDGWTCGPSDPLAKAAALAKTRPV